MRPLVLSLTMTLLLAASSSSPQAMSCQMLPQTIIARCPPLVNYTAAESALIGKARQKLRASGDPGNLLILRVLDDAYRLREGCRALLK